MTAVSPHYRQSTHPGANIGKEIHSMSKSLVLIVDDHPVMRDTLVQVFRWEPVNTLTAENGVQALAMLREIAPNLIILDVEMPGGVSGIDVLKAVRRNPRLAETPVILHTSESGVANLPEADAADLVLLKPADPDHLIMMVERLLGPRPAKAC